VLGQLSVLPLAEQPLDGAQGARRSRGQRGGQLQRVLGDVLVGDQARNEPQLVCRTSVQHLVGEQDVAGAGGADDPRQCPRHAAVRREAERGVRRPQMGARTAHHKVCRTRDAHACSGGPAVHGGDHRYGRLGEREQEGVESRGRGADEFAHVLGGGEGLDITARAEVGPGTDEQDATRVVTVPDCADRLDCLGERVVVQRSPVVPGRYRAPKHSADAFHERPVVTHPLSISLVGRADVGEPGRHRRWCDGWATIVGQLAAASF